MMGRSFLRLYLLLAITITLFIVGLKTLPAILLDDILAQQITDEAQGTFFLIRKELYSVSEDKWHDKINELKPHFGYHLELQKLSDLSFSKKQLKRINSGMLATIKDKFAVAETLYSLIPNTDKVISMSYRETGLEHFERSARGAYYIGIKHIKSHPKEEWHKALEEISTGFAYPLSLVLLDDLEIKKEYVEIVRTGGTYAKNPHGNGKTYYKRIPDSDYVIKAGPVHVSTFIVDLFHYAMALLAIMLAIAIYIWMRPISKDLVQLSNAAHDFGNGKFDTKISVRKNSAILRVTETFNGMAERIKKLIDSHKELTNAVSHELRTPISRLRFGIEMLKQSNNPETTQKYISSMNTDIDELDSLVSELLTYAQFDREKPDLNFESLHFESWINNFTEHHRIGGIEIDLQINENVESNNKQITIDSKLIHRAISNLINNAIRYATNNIRISTSHTDESFIISVEDDGPGVALNDREKILEPFKRLDFSRDRRSGGCGLGLSIVKQIASWHNGKITISDSSLGGAKFNFECPLNPA